MLLLLLLTTTITSNTTTTTNNYNDDYNENNDNYNDICLSLFYGPRHYMFPWIYYLKSVTYLFVKIIVLYVYVQIMFH
jgi:hypothetical protein